MAEDAANKPSLRLRFPAVRRLNQREFDDRAGQERQESTMCFRTHSKNTSRFTTKLKHFIQREIAHQLNRR